MPPGESGSRFACGHEADSTVYEVFATPDRGAVRFGFYMVAKGPEALNQSSSSKGGPDSFTDRIETGVQSVN